MNNCGKDELELLSMEPASEEYSNGKMKLYFSAIPINILCTSIYKLEPEIVLYLLNRFEPEYKFRNVVEACCFMQSMKDGLISCGYIKGSDEYELFKFRVFKETWDLLTRYAFSNGWYIIPANTQK